MALEPVWKDHAVVFILFVGISAVGSSVIFLSLFTQPLATIFLMSVYHQLAGKKAESQAEDAWTRIEACDGEKGPLMAEIIKRRVVAKIDRKIGPEETFVVIRTVRN